MPTSPLQLLTSLGFPGVARMIRAGRIGRKGAIDQVWHAYKVRDVEREGAVAASDAIRAYFVQKDARVKAVPCGTRANPAASKVKVHHSIYGPITVSVGDRAAVIHPAQKFLTVFGQYIEGHFSPDRMKKTRTYLTLAAAQRAATRYVEQAQGVKRNPTAKPTNRTGAPADFLADLARRGNDSDNARLIHEYPTNEEFRKKVEDHVWDVNQRKERASGRKNPATAKPKKPRKVKPRTAYNAQAYHFDAASWDRARVIRWLNRYGYKSADVQLVGPEYIAPQHESWDYEAKTLHRVQVAKHVEATVGVPLAGSDAASAPGYNKRFGQVGLFPKGKRPKKTKVAEGGYDWAAGDSDSPF